MSAQNGSFESSPELNKALDILLAKIPPPSATSAAVRYLERQRELAACRAMFVAAPADADDLRSALLPFILAHRPEIKAPPRLYWSDVQHEYQDVIDRLFFSKEVDNFLQYVSELLMLIFSEKPETLRSKAQVRLDRVLQFGSMQDFVEAYAEEEVQRLAYQGFAELNDSIERRIGFRLFSEAEALDKAALMIEMRNLFTHNDGFVNRRYLEKRVESRAAIGDRLRVAGTVAQHATEFFILSTIDIDTRARGALGISSGPTQFSSELPAIPKFMGNRNPRTTK